MSKGKTNPRKIPATQADVEKARAEGETRGVMLAMAIFLTVLVDKFNGHDYIQDVWKEVNSLSESISKGYVNFRDLKKVLEEEYEIFIG